MPTTTAPKKSPAVRKAALQAAKAAKLLAQTYEAIQQVGDTLAIADEEKNAEKYRAIAEAATKLRDRLSATTAKVFPAPAE